VYKIAKKLMAGGWGFDSFNHCKERGTKQALAAFMLALLGIGGARAELVVDVLGAGGPEITDGRASTSYLVSRDDRPILLVDTGPGSALAFERSGADFNALQAIVYTHLHVDHSADLPAYVKGAYFVGRQSDLPVFGPDGNRLLPAMDVFLQRMFGTEGVYPYLAEYLPGSPAAAYRLRPTVVAPGEGGVERFKVAGGVTISAISVEHGPLPALAWRVETQDCAITFTGDGNGEKKGLSALAHDTDLLVAHLAIGEDAGRIARRLHMPPSKIGEVAAEARVGSILLAHRMRRTDGREARVRREIARHYKGEVQLAQDGTRREACP